MTRVGRNAPCPCGSGKKYKRCCLASDAVTHYSQEDRASALGKLDDFIGERLGPEDDQAWDSYHERWDEDERVDDLGPERDEADNAGFEMWFAFDYHLPSGLRPVDELLLEAPGLSAGERAFLERVRDTSMRLYEVVDLSPGVSLTLRDLERGTSVTVRERSASRTLTRWSLLAARVVEPGASGQPEMERGVFAYPEGLREPLLARLHDLRRELRQERALDQPLEAELVGEVLHDAWLSSVLDPPLPRLTNTHGEDLVFTRVRFEVGDEAGLAAALSGRLELASTPEEPRVWRWSEPFAGESAARPPATALKEVSLGRIVLEESSLTLECNSAERAERGRALLEELAGGRLRHLSTVHESAQAALREAQLAGGGQATPPDTGLAAEEQDALVLDYLASHYRRWIDEPVPALDERTPREAAKDETLRPKAIALIRGLETAYQKALKSGQPAYDPCWMWAELGLPGGAQPAHPPPLARERMEALVPGLGEACRKLAAHVRTQPGFSDTETVITAADVETHLEVQRLLRDPHLAADSARPLADPVRWLAEYELHRRKTFWVSESLAYMLAKTDLEVPGAQLRVPFPSFALVFTDRHTLSLAERRLSRDPQCRVAGYLLRVLTVHVSEEHTDAARILRIGLAADPLGADPPHWLRYDLRLDDEVPLQRVLEAVAPAPIIDPPVPDVDPLRGLLHVALNAILYAVSAGVEAEVRLSPAAPPTRHGSPSQPYSSDQVYYLPGAIEISRLRQMQELERMPSGRHLLHRFMVRGHWRRPAPEWKDQRLRWIEPYWKGPDLAAVIERAYRLED